MKTGFAGLLFLAAASFASGLQVDKDELSKGQGANITFINYVGPHRTIDSVAAIVGIGRALGSRVGSNPGEFGYAGKYRVIHAVGAPEDGKLDADVFIIEPTAEVDDVVNVIRIVSGYLQAAYAYSPADAGVLARFVVYYNAAFRGDLKYFATVYTGLVMSYLSAADAGISTRYSDWPGKTRMLIPLSLGAEKGSLSAVGASQLAAPKVIQNLESAPGKALPERKELTELQQRGVEQGQAQVAAESAGIRREKRQLQAQEQSLGAAEQAAAKAQAAAAAPGATPQQKQAAAAAAATVQAQKQATQSQSQTIAQQESAVAAQQRQIAANQQAIQQQRATIASDEQAVINQSPTQPATAQLAAPGQVLFIYAVAGSSEHLGKLVLIDRVSGKLVSQSDLNSVRGRTYVRLGGSIVVVAGRTGGNGAVRLVAVDPGTLAVVTQGANDLAPTTYLAATATAVYAVVESGGGAYLARFDSTLALQAQSEEKVDPSTYITVSGEQVFVQDAAGNILILDKDDLKEKKKTG